MILVTGGAGFIGSALVKRLAKEGEQVRVIDDLSRGRLHRIMNIAGLNIIQGDVRKLSQMKEAFNGISEVIHLACVNGTENFYKMPSTVLSTGAMGILNVLDCCNLYSVDKLMFVSSSEVYQTPTVVPTPEEVPCVIPDPYNPRYSYAMIKMLSEMLVIHSTVTPRHATIIRPHNIYGPDMGNEHVIPQLAMRVKAGEELYFQGDDPLPNVNGRKVFYGGEQTRAFCYISDCIDQIMLVRQQGRHLGTYNVGSEEETSIIDLAQYIAKQAGTNIKYTTGKPSDGGTLRRCPDMSKLKAMGYIPRVPLREGLERTLQWYWREQ